jgi:hypothetical protein
MISGKRKTYEGDPDEIWIFNEGAARPDMIRLSTVPRAVKYVVDLKHHIKLKCKEFYSHITADNMIMRDNVTGDILPESKRISELVGNSSKQPYLVHGVDLTFSGVLSQISEDTYGLYMSQLRALQKAPFAKWFQHGSASSSTSPSSSGQLKESKVIVSSSVKYSQLNISAKKTGNGTGGEELRRRSVTVSRANKDMQTE